MGTEESNCDVINALFSHFFSSFLQVELTMWSRNARIDRSFKLACFDAEKDGRMGVYEIRFTTGLAEVVFAYYRADRGAYRLAE